MEFVNTKKQGDWGLGQAIAYFTRIGWTVSLPLTDSQDYDLIVDNHITLLKIQIKTTTYKQPSGNYCASLTIKGGNSGRVLKTFDPNKVDYVFIVSGDGKCYLIPSEVLGNSVTLWSKYTKYIV